MQISKPGHRKYIFRDCSEEQYCELVNGYSKGKKYGIRGIYAWCSGQSVAAILKEVAKGSVKSWGRKKLGSVVVVSCTWLSGPIAPMLTNSTRVLKAVRNLHSCSAFLFECVEDTSNLSFLPIDMILFGRPVPVGEENRFNILGNFTDFLDLDK